jgi:amidase
MTDAPLLEQFAFAGVAAQLDAMARGAVTSRELTEAALRRIERLDPQLNAFRVVLADEAVADADAADARRATGADGALLGVPVAIKDDTEQSGQVTMFGTGAPERASSVDSEVLRRLRAAGAVVVGRTNAPELLMWPFTESRTWGATRNPWDLARTPGGSSGGSAAAVAAGIVGVALGSDGGGSIRIPAACCGIFGLKTTRGLISINPHTDADHAFQGLAVYGPLARTVLDAALFLDATATPTAGGSYADAARRTPGPLRIGLATKPPLPGPVRRDVVAAARETGELLTSLGHTVREVSPRLRSAVPNFLIRYFAGIAHSGDALPRHERFEARTRNMARIGRAMPAGTVAWARRNERRVAAAAAEIFEQVDVLLTPALAAPPVPVGRWQNKGALRTLTAVAMWTPYTVPWNVTGQPAAAVPTGMTSDGMPMAVQIVGPLGAEHSLLSLAAQIESERPWTHRRPPIS